MPQADIRATLGPAWLVEGPVVVPGLDLVKVRVRRIDAAAASNELHRLSAHAPSTDGAWSKLRAAIAQHRPDAAPAAVSYDEWVAGQHEWRYPGDELDYASAELRRAWEGAAAGLAPGWSIDAVTTYFEGVGSGRWSAHVTAPHLCITSQHQFVGRAAYGDDPVGALEAMAKLLPSIDPAETV